MREPERGDLLEVVWLDIQEDVTGDPDAASLARRTSYGLFWDRRENNGVPAVITTTTLDEDLAGQNGYCIYPQAVIVGFKIIKRGRRAPKKRAPVHPVSRRDEPGASENDVAVQPLRLRSQ